MPHCRILDRLQDEEPAKLQHDCVRSPHAINLVQPQHAIPSKMFALSVRSLGDSCRRLEVQADATHRLPAAVQEAPRAQAAAVAQEARRTQAAVTVQEAPRIQALEPAKRIDNANTTMNEGLGISPNVVPCRARFMHACIACMLACMHMHACICRHTVCMHMHAHACICMQNMICMHACMGTDDDGDDGVWFSLVQRELASTPRTEVTFCRTRRSTAPRAMAEEQHSERE